MISVTLSADFEISLEFALLGTPWESRRLYAIVVSLVRVEAAASLCGKAASAASSCNLAD